MVFRLFRLEVFEHGKHHGRGEFFRAESVSAAVNSDVRSALLEERRAYVEIEGLAEGAGLLGSVEDGQLLAGSGDRADKRRRIEGTVQADFENAVCFALRVQLIDGFLNRLRARTHDDDHFFRVRCADVIEQVIRSARIFGNGLHHLRNDCGNGFVIGVCCLSVLEIGISVLGGALLDRVLGVERAGLEFVHVFLHAELVEDRLDFRIVVRFVEALDLGIFVRGSEPVEEVQEGDAGFQRGQVRDEREIHNFLNG